MTVLYPSEDYDATTDDIAFPQEWLRPLAWQVTLEAAPAYERDWTQAMQQNYQQAMAIAQSLNPENSVLYFQSAE